MEIVPVVKSPLQFLQVAIHMLAAYFMEGCGDRPLEQAPDTVDAVGMDVTDAPLFLGVLDCLLAR